MMDGGEIEKAGNREHWSAQHTTASVTESSQEGLSKRSKNFPFQIFL